MPTYRERAATRAAKFIGVKESPPDSNHGPKIDQWCYITNGVHGGYPWCAAFQFAQFRASGLDLVKKGLSGPALVENWVKWAKSHGYTVTRPLKWDIVCFDWDPDGWRDHIGIVEKVLALRWRKGKFTGLIRTIEGNTSTNNQSNGGEVQRRWRWVNGEQVFIRIPYEV